MIVSSALSDDLRVLGLDEKSFIRAAATQSLGAVLSGMFLVLLATWVIGWPGPTICAVAVVIPPIATWFRLASVRQRDARRRRQDMDLAVAVFLDLVNVLLAGGAGIETAMLAAAGAGDGWSFEMIRFALVRAQSSRTPYWDALLELGQSLGVESLDEVAHSVQLAGEHGARIRQSLSSKAQALRMRNLARIEHDAQQQTERMGLPIVALFIAFILLVGYPAYVGTVGSL